MLLKDHILKMIYDNQRWITSTEIKTHITHRSHSAIKTALTDLRRDGYLNARYVKNQRQLGHEYEMTDKGIFKVTGKEKTNKPMHFLQMPTPEQIQQKQLSSHSR